MWRKIDGGAPGMNTLWNSYKKRSNITIFHRDINDFYGHFSIAMLNYQRVNQFIIQRIIGFLVDVFTVEPVL
jgi:hypothetical protein